MSKLVNIMFFISVLGYSSSVWGFGLPKIDIGASTSKAVSTVTGFLEAAKKKMDESVALQTVIIYGKGAVETAKQVQEVKQKAEERIDDFKEDPLSAGLDLAKEDPLSAGLDLADEVVANIDDEKLNSLTEKISAKTSDSQELLDLNRQKEKLEQELNEKLAAEQAAADGKIQVLEQNNTNLAKQMETDAVNKDKYQQQIDENNKKIAELKAQSALTQQTLNSEGQVDINKLASSISNLEAKAQAAVQAQKDKVAAALQQKIDSFDSQGSLEETTEKNFLSENDPETSQSIVEQKAYRTYVAGQDTLDTFAQAVIVQSGLNDDNILTQKIADRAGAVDGSIAAINIDAQVKSQNAQAIGKLIEIMIADLKLQTSSELASSEYYTIQNDDDIATFTLDKYKMEDKSSSSKEE